MHGVHDLGDEENPDERETRDEDAASAPGGLGPESQRPAFGVMTVSPSTKRHPRSSPWQDSTRLRRMLPRGERCCAETTTHSGQDTVSGFVRKVDLRSH
jgi:hypothetical protein